MTLPRPYLSVRIIFAIFMKWSVPFFSAWTSEEVLQNRTWPLSPFTSDLMWNGHDPWIADLKVAPITRYSCQKIIQVFPSSLFFWTLHCVTGDAAIWELFLSTCMEKLKVLHQFWYVCYVYGILANAMFILGCIIKKQIIPFVYYKFIIT